jgi:hypothetical protein
VQSAHRLLGGCLESSRTALRSFSSFFLSIQSLRVQEG